MQKENEEINKEQLSDAEIKLFFLDHDYTFYSRENNEKDAQNIKKYIEMNGEYARLQKIKSGEYKGSWIVWEKVKKGESKSAPFTIEEAEELGMEKLKEKGYYNM